MPGRVTAPTLGVEEEFLLLDPATGENAPAADAVLAGLAGGVREQSRLEFRHSMVEMVTPVCAGLAEVEQQLRLLRGAAGAAARAAGARLAALGATPIAEALPTAVTDNARFQAIARHYGPIIESPAVCGCHVHVGVADRELAIRVGNHIRGRLPIIQALAVNSPLSDGKDCGHASWRAMLLDRWPTLGPPPLFESPGDFDDTVRKLVGSGAMLDETLVLWHVRPSARYPTVEIRVTDVCPTVADTVLVAGLIRGLVATAVDDITHGVAPPAIPDGLLRAAHFNAAHSGLSGTLLDLHEGRPRPAWELVDDLLTLVRPALHRFGDLDLVDAELARLRKDGTGADRQRRILEGTGDVRAVLAGVADWTEQG